MTIRFQCQKQERFTIYIFQHRNGVLQGYQIHVKHVGNGSKAFHSNVTLNATATRLLLAANLSLGEAYSVRACALTGAGRGPFSDPVAFTMDPALLVKYPIVR